MSRTVRRPPVILLAALTLAGCIGVGDQPDASPVESQQRSTPANLDHLDGTGAAIVDKNDTRTFVYEGTVGAGSPAGPILLLSAGRISGDQSFHEFEVDGSVGLVETSFQPLDNARYLLQFMNSAGDRMCEAFSESTDCNRLLVNEGLPLATWSVVVESAQPDSDNPYRLSVTLHPRSHLPPAIRPGGLDDTLSFRLSDTGVEGAEPSVGVTSQGHLFVVEGDRTLRSRDDGKTWEDVTAPTTTATLDPMLYVDPWTDRVLVAHLYGACSYLSWSDDDGETWMTNPAVCGPGAGNDFEKLTVGAHPTPGDAAFDGTIYYSFTDFELAANPRRVVVTRSLDGGFTWQSAVAVPDQPDHNNGGQPVADREGNVYVGVDLVDGGFAVSASHDHGATWELRKAGDYAKNDGGVAIDTAGNVYGAYWGPKGVRVVVSEDKGATWEGVRTVSPSALKSFVFADTVAGDEGRVAVAYYATADASGGPDGAPPGSQWHLYLSMSENANVAEPTWTTTRVTEGPVQLGEICTLGTGTAGCTGNRNLLDFIDVQAGPDGRIYIAYTDGCPEGCLEQSDRSRGMVAIQEDGPRLFVDKAPWI